MFRVLRETSWVCLATVLVCLAASGEARADSYDSDRNEVRSRIAAGGWNPVYGELVNEAEYAKFAASVYFGNPAAYFQDYYRRTVARMRHELPNVAARSVENAVRDALRGRNVRIGRLGIKGGIATYRRWKRIVYHEPATRRVYKKFPWGGGMHVIETYMDKKERIIPLPNHHQPYIAFRYYSTSSSSGGGADGSHGSTVKVAIRLSDDYSQYKSYYINGSRFECHRGRKRSHSRSGSAVTIKFDNILGDGRSTYTEMRLRSGTYEFRRNGNRAYLVRVGALG